MTPKKPKYRIRPEGEMTDRLIQSMDEYELLEHMGVPLRFRSRAARMVRERQDFPPIVEGWMEKLPYIFRPQQDKADEFPDLCGNGLVLYGQSGSGKTTMAAALLLYIIKNRLVVNCDPAGRSDYYGAPMGHFLDWQEVSDLFRESVADEDSKRALSRVHAAMLGAGPRTARGDFLVIDDVSRERITEFNLGKLAHILRTRVNDGYPTIITTNHPPEVWSDVYGPVMGPFLARSFLHVEVDR